LSFGWVEVDILPSEGCMYCKLNKLLYDMVNVRFLDTRESGNLGGSVSCEGMHCQSTRIKKSGIFVGCAIIGIYLLECCITH